MAESIEERTLRLAVVAQTIFVGLARAIFIGFLVSMAGLLPPMLLSGANLRYYPSVPWAVPLMALYLWLFWRYLNGAGPPQSTVEERREGLRANRVPRNVWAWALLAGGLGIGALVVAFRVGNRLLVLPQQEFRSFVDVPEVTVLAVVLVAAVGSAIVNEAAFRGYMQGPIERRHGVVVAILITGTVFTLAHVDFTLFLWLWPYYVAMAAIYGTVTYLTQSILPSVVLHTGWNLYANLDVWLHGQAEWPASTPRTALIWTTGADASFWISSTALVFVAAGMVWAYLRLARVARRSPA